MPLDSVQPVSGLVAQSVEQRPFKPLVAGSSPAQPTTFFPAETAQKPRKTRTIHNMRRLGHEAIRCKRKKRVA